MPSKYNLTVELSKQTVRELSSSPGKYMSFLITAANNYKYSFADQILIHAQKPSATACAEIEMWNKLGRWVNKGTKGITLLVDRDIPYKLRHVFDIADTNSRYGHEVRLWAMKDEYAEQVVDDLENSFGELEDKSGFEKAVIGITEMVVQDNYSDYLEQLTDVRYGSILEELDEGNLRREFRDLLIDSVAFQVLTRCGYGAADMFDPDDFSNISDFNTPATISVIGSASSDISEMVLREIEATVRSAAREEIKNRTFAEKQKKTDNRGENKNAERSDNYGTDLQTGGRLPSSESRSAGSPEDREIWDASASVSQRSQKSDSDRNADVGRTEQPPRTNRPRSDGDGGTPDETDGTGTGRERTDEEDRSDEVGSDDELAENVGGGDRSERTHLQLSGHDFNARSEIPYYYAPDEKNELLRNCLALKNHRKEIAAFFEAHPDRRERGDFIKTFFDNTYVEHILENGERVGYRAYDDLLTIWHGSYLSRDKEDFLHWWRVADAIEGQILLDTWLADDEKDLISEDGQLRFLDSQAEQKKNEFAIPQAAIDYVLTRGSGVSQGKMRIYEQFQKQETADKNIAFLKDEYGVGGYSDPIPESGYWEQHDGKGIELRKGDNKILLPWNKVAKRIGELIDADRYLNKAEKAAYPAYLAEKEERERRYQFAGRFNSLVEDFNDYETQINNDIVIIDRFASREFASLFGQGERVSRGYGNTPDVFVLPALRDILERIIAENTHLTDRAQELLDELDETDIAKPFELTESEKNPPPEPKKGLRFSLGDKVYIGSKEYEILGLEDPVVLFDPEFPILTQDIPRDEFFQKAAENPLNDKHLVVIEEATVPNETDLEAEQAINAHEAEFGADGTRAFLEPEKLPVYDRTTEILYAVLHKLNMDDVGLDFEGEDIIAFDEDNQWKGKEFFRFLIDECFVFEDGGHVTGIDDELLADFTALAAHNGVLVTDNRYYKPWREYLQAKLDYPGAIVLYRIGDFYEVMGNDAEKVAEELSLHLGSRSYLLDKRTPMCGFPAHRLDAYVDMLHDRGHDVVLYEDGKGERLDSPYKNNPVDTMPVARIDVLDDDGQVEISTDFTDESAFLRNVFEENERGTKMRVVLYRDDNGRTIPTNFVEEMKPPYPTYDFVDSPFVLQNQEDDLVRAERLINKYSQKEFGQAAYFGDIHSVGLAYTTITDEDLEIQVTANLKEPSIDKYISGVLVERQLFDSLREMCDFLEDLDFNELTDYTDEQVETAKQQLKPAEPEKEEATLAPPPQKVKRDLTPHVLYPEIKSDYRTNFKIEDDDIGVGTPLERFHHNIMAIQLLHKLEDEHRLADTNEQRILADYVGWGGLAEFFEETNHHYNELLTVLNDDELASARESTLTAFYTPPVVIKAIYQTLENMGFKNGNILEPSCGIGNFMGLIPDSMAELKIYGVELDSISGRIAQQLYQRNNIAVQGFENTDLPDSFFDAALGNVPFGNFKLSDKRYDKNNFLIHDYFFAKTLDKVRPGGIVAFITSHGTLDKENPSVRKYIAQRADLLGAIRLPNNTFKDAAGTEVTADILFLQKRDRLVDIEPDWVHLGTDENGITMNQYFIDNPDMIIGEMKTVSGPFGPEPTCEPYEDQSLTDGLNEAIQSIHAEITEVEFDDLVDEGEDNSIPADPSVRNFSYTVIDGKVYYRVNSRMNPAEVSITAENRIKGMIRIRDCVRELIEYQMEDYPDEQIAAKQKELNDLYDDFSKKYGLINSRANNSAFSQDSSYYLLTSLENLDDEGNFVGKADMFTKRTIRQKVIVTSVDTASEALALSLAEKTKVDMPYMCELTGKTEEEIAEELRGVIFLNPLNRGDDDEIRPKYLPADEYLSGNIREKLEWAKRSAELYPEDYTVNVQALEQVMPKDLSASEVSVRLGSTWIPVDDVNNFMWELFGTPW